MREKILPYAQHAITAAKKHHAHTQHTYEQLMEYFLIHFLTGELNSMDEVVDKDKVHAA